MKHKAFIYLGFFLVVIILAYRKDNNQVSKKETLPEEQTAAPNWEGAKQISGIGFFATAGKGDNESQGAAYDIGLAGDFECWLYAFIDNLECSSSGGHLRF